jgi:hypothetical protein
MKCQPKSRLLRRQKSASEIEARYFGGGNQDDNDSELKFFLMKLSAIAALSRNEGQLFI